MYRTDLLKKMLPGFIPLFVFIAIDEIWGTRAGLIASVVIGVGEMVWIGWKEKRFDSFVLLDTALLVIMGGVSYILDNDIFFKLKPGLVELILCAVLAISSFSRYNIMGMMSKRYLKGMTFSEDQMTKMQKTTRLMFYVFLAHTVLVFYSAFFMSDASWAFISGGLFYLLFGVVFIVEWYVQRQKNKQLMKEEQLPLVDEKGEIIGKAPRSLCHNGGDKPLHPVVHLHLLKKNKVIYLQMRPLDKLIQPGKWDTAVGGHVSFGEDIKTALERESWEELGIKNFSASILKTYVWESPVERELVYVFVSNNFKDINLHSDEVKEGRFWTFNEIEKNIGKDVFTPNFEYEFKLFFSKK